MIEKERKTENVNIRIEPRIKIELERAAKKDHRSVAGALVIAIKFYVEKILGKKI